MTRGWVHTRSRPFTLLLGLLAAACVCSIIMYPDLAFQSSLKGLKLWWDWVFPALLPFFILTELLLGFGVVHGLGVLLEPFMRKVFRLPGQAGWAFAAGLAGGYPLGADATAKLRNRGDLTRAGAERLLSVSHLCNPMLMVGVVGAGFLHSPEAGIMLMLLHYASAAVAYVVVYLVDRSKKPLPGEPEPSSDISRVGRNRHNSPSPAPKRAGLWQRTADAMQTARQEDGRAFGKLLGDAVSSSIQALMLIGGLIMIFSVLIRIIDLQAGSNAVGEWLMRLLPGLLEPHLGAYAYSQATGWASPMQAACIGGVLGWGGFSLHLQVLSFTNGTDIRYGPFFRFRMLHGACAALMTLALWNPLGRLLQGTEHVFSPSGGLFRSPFAGAEGWSFQEIAAMWSTAGVLLALLLAAMLLGSLLLRVLEKATPKS